mgnify:CR=1 FL=1
MPLDIEAGVRDYYGKTLKSGANLKTDACCSPADLPRAVREALAKVNDEVTSRYYGCGLTIPSELAGLSVLDLGSGSGRDCYILSQLVGGAGRVTGVDMTDEQLEVAEPNRAHHARAFGYGNGEPFMNPELLAMAEECLQRGFSVLILTNAMAPMTNRKRELLDLRARRGRAPRLRVSLDHHTAAAHDAERGTGAFDKAVAGLRWLLDSGFDASVAGRTFVEEDENAAREGYRRAIGRDVELTVFPEMDAPGDLPEITTECWGILGKTPESVMCASSRMVVKRRGEASPAVVACTLIPYDARFELGRTVRESWRPVALQHPHCASFCVLGGGSCAA